MWVQIWHDLSSARAPRPPARPRVLSVSDLARDNRHADTSRARVCSRPRSRVRGSGWASSRSAAVACGFFFHLAHLHHHRLSQLSNQTVTCPLQLRSKRRTQKPCGSAPVMTGLRRSSARTSRRTTHRATHTHTHRLARWRLCVLGPSARIASPSRPRDPHRPRASSLRSSWCP